MYKNIVQIHRANYHESGSGLAPMTMETIELMESTECNENGMAWDAEKQSWRLTQLATDAQVKAYQDMAYRIAMKTYQHYGLSITG